MWAQACQPSRASVGDVTSSQSPDIDRSSRPWDLIVARVLTLGPGALAFPVATLAVFVFVFEINRNWTADPLAVVYSAGLFLGFTTSLLAVARSAQLESLRTDRITGSVLAGPTLED